MFVCFVQGGGEVCGKKRGVCFVQGGLRGVWEEERCVLYRGGLRGVWEEERCEEEQVKRTNRREEMTREEKMCGEEGDGLMDLMDGMY